MHVVGDGDRRRRDRSRGCGAAARPRRPRRLSVDHRAVQVEQDAVEPALSATASQICVGDVLEGRVVDRARRRARRRRSAARPRPSRARRCRDRRRAPTRCRETRRSPPRRRAAPVRVRTAPAASAPARRCWSRASSSRSTGAWGLLRGASASYCHCERSEAISCQRNRDSPMVGVSLYQAPRNDGERHEDAAPTAS